MRITSTLVLFLTFYLFSDPNLLAKELNQRKDELKKIYQAGGISKVEYENSLKTLEQSNQEEKTTKKTFAFKKQKKENELVNFFKKDKELEKITLEKIEELGKPIKFDDTYYTKGRIEKIDYKIRNLTTPQRIQLSSPLFAIKSNQCLIDRKIENTINTFRAVFSCLDNKDYDFLESKTILVGYPDWENPFDVFF